MLLGPNGAGKTTLFSLIARLLPLTSGRIEICGRDLAASGANILAETGIVFQQPALDLDLTVEQNFAYFAALHGLARSEARARMDRALAQGDLAGSRTARVRSLSGGHRRRTEIARVLMGETRLLLLDEPTVGLDMPTRRSQVEFFHALAPRTGMAILWATHLADEVWPDDGLVIIAAGKVRAAGSCTAVIRESGEASFDAAFGKLVSEPAP